MSALTSHVPVLPHGVIHTPPDPRDDTSPLIYRTRHVLTGQLMVSAPIGLSLEDGAKLLESAIPLLEGVTRLTSMPRVQWDEVSGLHLHVEFTAMPWRGVRDLERRLCDATGCGVGSVYQFYRVQV